MLAMQGHRNIVASKGISGNVSANLFDVTLSEALEVILRANDFRMEESGNFLYIFTREEFDEIVRSRMKKSSRCAVCNEPTQGIFNTAIKIRDAIRRSGGDPSKRSTVLPRAAVEEDEFAGVRGKSAAAERERESELGWRIGMSDAL